MTLPISTYGSSVLRKGTEEIDENYPDLKKLILDMFETIAKADGVGLAAPQINKPIRLFVVDGDPIKDEDPDLAGFRKVFINPIIISESGEMKSYVEGCLSIPNIREAVSRKSTITIEYFDENFQLVEETFSKLKARIIQHEYDHLEGVLFTDKISPIKKRLLKNKLNSMTKGKFQADYKVRVPSKR